MKGVAFSVGIALAVMIGAFAVANHFGLTTHYLGVPR